MRDLIDFMFAIILFILLLPLMIIISLLIKMSSNGPVIFWSDRVGKNNKLFTMPKFRTMIIETPDVATHLLNNPVSYYSPVGSFLRKTSLDEIPQLFSIIKGDMRFIGPRPALYNQDDLIKLRSEKGIDSIKPGITGWAQVNGRDNISIREKVLLDEEYLKSLSLWKDIRIIFMTILKVLSKESIKH